MALPTAPTFAREFAAWKANRAERRAGPGTHFKLDAVVNGLPVAASGTVGPFMLRIWAAIDAAPLDRVGDVPVTASQVTWQGDFPAGRPVRCWFALVDPIGREGEPFKVEQL